MSLITYVAIGTSVGVCGQAILCQYVQKNMRDLNRLDEWINAIESIREKRIERANGNKQIMERINRRYGEKGKFKVKHLGKELYLDEAQSESEKLRHKVNGLVKFSICHRVSALIDSQIPRIPKLGQE